MSQSEAGRRLGTILGHLKATPSPSNRESKRYRYSRDKESAGVLSPEQRDFYEQNGFLVVKGLVSRANLDVYKERFRQICTKEVHVGYSHEYVSKSKFNGRFLA